MRYDPRAPVRTATVLMEGSDVLSLSSRKFFLYSLPSSTREGLSSLLVILS